MRLRYSARNDKVRKRTVSLTFPFDWPSKEEAKNECRKCMWLVRVVRIDGCLTQIHPQLRALSKSSVPSVRGL